MQCCFKTFQLSLARKALPSGQLERLPVQSRARGHRKHERQNHTHRPGALHSVTEDTGQRRLIGGQTELMKYVWVIFAEIYEQYLPNFTSNGNCSQHAMHVK